MKKRQMQPSRSAAVIQYEVSTAPAATRLPHLSERLDRRTDLLRRGPGVCRDTSERMKGRQRSSSDCGLYGWQTPCWACRLPLASFLLVPSHAPCSRESRYAFAAACPTAARRPDMKSNTQTGCLIDFHTRSIVVSASAAKHQGMRRLWCGRTPCTLHVKTQINMLSPQIGVFSRLFVPFPAHYELLKMPKRWDLNLGERLVVGVRGAFVCVNNRCREEGGKEEDRIVDGNFFRNKYAKESERAGVQKRKENPGGRGSERCWRGESETAQTREERREKWSEETEEGRASSLEAGRCASGSSEWATAPLQQRWVKRWRWVGGGRGYWGSVKGGWTAAGSSVW